MYICRARKAHMYNSENIGTCKNPLCMGLDCSMVTPSRPRFVAWIILDINRPVVDVGSPVFPKLNTSSKQCMHSDHDHGARNVRNKVPFQHVAKLLIIRSQRQTPPSYVI